MEARQTFPRAALTEAGIPIDWTRANVVQLRHEDDNEPYRVWKIVQGSAQWILKEAKAYETEVYDTFFAEPTDAVPRLVWRGICGERTYLLMEFVDGHDLRACTRRDLTLVLDALIALQAGTWQKERRAACAYSHEASLPARNKRRAFLRDSVLEAAYDVFLQCYAAVPRALCHDDLLPFNVLVDGARAVLIDWEYAGILPYATSFARLIAHGEPREGALFFLSQPDRVFAISYYYEQLLRKRGISWEEWQETLDCFLFYEYCEWVMIGNRYDATDSENYRKYLPLAREQAKKILAQHSGEKQKG